MRKVLAQRIPGENAIPASHTIRQTDGVVTVIHGGLTKLEWMAAQIAGPIIAANPHMDMADIALTADALLGACEEHQR